MKRPTVTLYCKTNLSIIELEPSNMFSCCVGETISWSALRGGLDAVKL